MITPNILETLRNRRSIRKFEDRLVEAKKVDALIEAALRAPSSRGTYPWEFIVVTDPVLLRRLGKAKEHGAAFLADAPMAVVVAADPDKCDVWTEDCSIAAILLQLAAEELGLGSCWAQIRLRSHDTKESAEDYLKKMLCLPDTYIVECVIGIGYPGEQKSGHARESLLFERVHCNRFSA